MTARRGTYPLTIGVTGHRFIDTASTAELEQAVTRVLEVLRDAAPHTPLLMLSALAEGADRLVPQVAIDRFAASLIAVLPMAAEEYARDFDTGGSRAEFDCLLARAVEVVVTASPSFDPGDRAQRRVAYARAGEWVALHSQVLIALWDGEAARGHGGTAEVVQAKLGRRYPHLGQEDLLAFDEKRGAVAHVHTPRRGTGRSPRDRAIVRWLYPGAEKTGAYGAEAHFREALSALDRLNQPSVAR